MFRSIVDVSTLRFSSQTFTTNEKKMTKNKKMESKSDFDCGKGKLKAKRTSLLKICGWLWKREQNQFSIAVICNLLSEFASSKQRKPRCSVGKLENLMRSRVTYSENCFGLNEWMNRDPSFSLSVHSRFLCSLSWTNDRQQPFQTVWTNMPHGTLSIQIKP